MAIDLKSFDGSFFKKLMDPAAADDLNVFLEKLPQTAGQSALIAAGIAWMAAASLGLFATIQVQNMTEMRAKLKETQALKPAVPVLRNVPVAQKEVANFAQSLVHAYPGLDIKQQGASIQISAQTTALFGVFREAISHVQNGGSGWRVAVDKICVGRDCGSTQLSVTLKINKVSVDSPTG